MKLSELGARNLGAKLIDIPLEVRFWRAPFLAVHLPVYRVAAC